MLCLECGACTASCPVNGHFNPRLFLRGQSSSDLWSCTTCYCCYEVCPTEVDIPAMVKSARRHSAMPDIHAVVLERLYETGMATPASESVLEVRRKLGIGVPCSTQFDPRALEEVRCLLEAGEGDGSVIPQNLLEGDGPVCVDDADAVCFYPGCVSANVMPEVESASKACLEALGVDVLDMPGYSCCPSTGAVFYDEWRWALLAARSLAIAEEEGVPLVVTSCNGCFTSLHDAYLVLKDRKVRENRPKAKGEEG